MLMLNSEHMVLWHLKHRTLCSWFLLHHSYSDLIYHGIKIPTRYLNFEYKNCWKPPWSSEIILTKIAFRNKGSAFSMSKLKMAHGKKILSNPLYGRIIFTLTWPVKLYQQKKEYVNFIITQRHHPVRPSLMLQWGKVVPKSCRSHLKGWTRRPFFVLRLGPSVTIIVGKLPEQHDGWCDLW